MFGFVVAAFSLAGLAAIALTERRHGRFGRTGLYRVLSRLDTSPGQEKIIRTAVDDLRDHAKDVWTRERDARPELAAILAEPQFNNQAVDAWFDQRFAALTELRQTAVRSLQAIHDVLDDRQKKEMSRLLTSGPFCRGRGHHAACHHSHHHCH